MFFLTVFLPEVVHKAAEEKTSLKRRRDERVRQTGVIPRVPGKGWPRSQTKNSHLQRQLYINIYM
jgi:hypothetical protein